LKDRHLLIFDLDGTLIDSKLDLAASVNAMLAYKGRPAISLETVAEYVGNGAPVLVRRALGPEASEQEVEESLLFFLDYYREHMLDATTLYPGVREALARLHAASTAMAVLTNKPWRFSQALLMRLNIGRWFFRIYGGNSFADKKPNPVGIETLMSESGVGASRTTMVGDSAVDVRTARNAGVTACGCRWGFQPETFASDPPDFYIDDMGELADRVLGE